MTAPKGSATRPASLDRAPSRVQRQARALGDPTRFAIFQSVAAASAPMRVAELTRQFGLNHNAIRQHLAKLCDAELLVEQSASRSGPGRPALQYRLAPGVPGAWVSQSPYESLSLLLLEIVQDGKPALEVGREAGRVAATAVQDVDETPLDSLVAEMQRRGFEPRAVRRSPRDVDVVLDVCPFAAAAGLAPGVVCEIHRGLADGFLEGLPGDEHVIDLQVHNPLRAGCRLKVRTTGD